MRSIDADTIPQRVRESKFSLFAGLALIPLLLSHAGPAVGQPFSDETVREIVKERLTGKRDLGIVVGLFEGKSGRTLAFGQSGDGASSSLDGDTIFEIGSVTKTFTATLLAEMATRGEVRLDDPVAKCLPASVRVPGRNERAITLLDLATQTSGLPSLPTNFHPRDPKNPYMDYTTTQMYEFLSSYRLRRGPGEKYEYSNLGFGFLGHALARRAGTSYEELVKIRILDRLKMADTSITLTAAMKTRLAPGHDAEGHAVPNWDIPTLAGCGALRSSVNDMLKYLAAELGGAPPELARAMAMTQTVRRPSGRDGLDIALAWHVLHRPGHDIVWHNGGTGGYHSFVGFEPKRGVGVVLLSNWSANLDDIGVHLLDESYAVAGHKE